MKPTSKREQQGQRQWQIKVLTVVMANACVVLNIFVLDSFITVHANLALQNTKKRGKTRLRFTIWTCWSIKKSSPTTNIHKYLKLSGYDLCMYLSILLRKVNFVTLSFPQKVIKEMYLVLLILQALIWSRSLKRKLVGQSSWNFLDMIFYKIKQNYRLFVFTVYSHRGHCIIYIGHQD